MMLMAKSPVQIVRVLAGSARVGLCLSDLDLGVLLAGLGQLPSLADVERADAHEDAADEDGAVVSVLDPIGDDDRRPGRGERRGDNGERPGQIADEALDALEPGRRRLNGSVGDDPTPFLMPIPAARAATPARSQGVV